jgi:antirestriction protein ArdC
MARAYPAFNCAQVDGYTSVRPEPIPIAERIENSEEFFRHVGADVRHGGPKASYSPAPTTSRCRLGKRSGMPRPITPRVGHEHGHWTGGEKRLARNLKGRFGSEVHRMEELVTKLGAAFLYADLRLAVNPRPSSQPHPPNSQITFPPPGRRTAASAVDSVRPPAEVHPLSMNGAAPSHEGIGVSIRGAGAIANQ